MYFLVDYSWLFRAILVEIRIFRGCKRRTSTDCSVVGRISSHALFDGSLLDLRIPTVEEIAVKAVACSVALGEDEHSSVIFRNGVGEVNNLEENMRQEHWIPRWTDTIIHTGQVGHVALV